MLLGNATTTALLISEPRKANARIHIVIEINRILNYLRTMSLVRRAFGDTVLDVSFQLASFN